jgi:hypothetical protein
LLGTANVNGSGQASLTTQTTTYASYSFYAVYSGDSDFAASTSAVNKPTASFTVVPTAASVTIPQGGVATFGTNITPLYNYSGTITAACSGLPANSLCRFHPVSLSLSGTAAQNFTVFLYTNVQSNLASLTSPDEARGHRAIYVAQLFGWPVAVGLLFFLSRRKRLASGLRLLSLAALAVAATAGVMSLNGCSSNNSTSNSSYVTPQGTSSVSVKFSDSSGVVQTVTFNFTVSAPYPLP